LCKNDLDLVDLSLNIIYDEILWHHLIDEVDFHLVVKCSLFIAEKEHFVVVVDDKQEDRLVLF
jgi:hypothetical protein